MEPPGRAFYYVGPEGGGVTGSRRTWRKRWVRGWGGRRSEPPKWAWVGFMGRERTEVKGEAQATYPRGASFSLSPKVLAAALVL